MKILKIYMKNDEYVIERVNEFNHATKRFFITEEGLFEGVQAYQDELEQYELEVTDALWSKVINFLNSEKIQSHGGKREGAGRPALGVSKRVALTLPQDTWDKIEKLKESTGEKQSAVLRSIIEGYLENMEKKTS